MSKKIYITKNDTAEMAVIKVLKSKEEKVVLSVPNFSQLANSAENFSLLKKETEESGKELLIESVDDVVVELARRNEIEATNPFFSQSKKNIKSLEPEPVVIDEPEVKESVEISKNGRKFSVTFASLTLIILLLPGIYVAYTVLPEASVKITTQKMDWDYNATLTVDKAALALNLETKKIPGQIFSQKKNGQLTFPATGEKNLNKKATGNITIYNNHSSAPQSLVASTRFESPDGKIFRLVEAVTVPGAAVNDGKVTPSSITAKVIADRGGESYNIGSVEKWTIPGFKHTSKEKTFYGVSTETMRGGFTGKSAYPTDEDIKSAKEKSALTLEDGLKNLIKNEIPAGFKFVEDSSKFTISKQTVNTDINEQNEFSIFTEAEISIMAFRESDINEVINSNIKKELSSDLKPKTFTLVYGEGKFDSVKGILTLPVTYKAKLEYPIDTEKLKGTLVGKSELELKALLFSIPGLASANISFWPFWVDRVPAVDKVDITVE